MTFFDSFPYISKKAKRVWHTTQTLLGWDFWGRPQEKKEGQRTFRNWKPKKKRKEKQENFGQNINKNIPVVAVGYQSRLAPFYGNVSWRAKLIKQQQPWPSLSIHPSNSENVLAQKHAHAKKKRQNQHNIRSAHICAIRHRIIYSSLPLERFDWFPIEWRTHTVRRRLAERNPIYSIKIDEKWWE